MVAILLGCDGCALDGGDLGAAYHHMWFAGAGIEIDEFATIEIGNVLSVWRPRDVFGWVTNERAMREDLLHGEWHGGALR
jgi:hypothetical protein